MKLKEDMKWFKVKLQGEGEQSWPIHYVEAPTLKQVSDHMEMLEIDGQKIHSVTVASDEEIEDLSNIHRWGQEE